MMRGKPSRMARGASTFRQRDLTAAVKAVVRSGYDVVRVEVDKAGKIVVVTRTTSEPAPRDNPPDREANEWDRVV